MMGGAYGAFASSETLEGIFSLATYRDPEPLRSLTVFPEILNKRAAAGIGAAKTAKAMAAMQARERSLRMIDASKWDGEGVLMSRGRRPRATSSPWRPGAAFLARAAGEAMSALRKGEGRHGPGKQSTPGEMDPGSLRFRQSRRQPGDDVGRRLRRRPLGEVACR